MTPGGPHRPSLAPAGGSARAGLGSPGTGVLVTGGASGVGRQTALALAEVGRPVAVWDLDGPGAEATATECRQRHGVPTSWAAIDVADSAAVASRVPTAAAALGSLGGLVHAAAVSGPMPLDDLDDARWDRALHVNVRAGAILARAVLEPFRQAGPGSAVVLVSSIEGLVGNPDHPPYCASKAAVLGLVRSVAARFGPEGFRVNAVCPGAVDTPMLARALSVPGFRERMERATPLRRVADPGDIARPIRFLLSEEAAFITGTYLVVDGGVTSIVNI